MKYEEILKTAKERMGGLCMACPICNGRACSNKIPGPGAKGTGDVAARNYDKWQEIRLNMNTISDISETDTSCSFFGKNFSAPIFAGPIGAVDKHYSDYYNDVTYNEVLVAACAEAGIAAFTGDGLSPEVMKAAAKALKDNKGIGVPTVKPWNMELIKEKIDLVRSSGCFALAMDIDAAGLPFLKNMNPPAGPKTIEQLKEIADYAKVPFLLKGIMTVTGALAAVKAGASGIVVSNHGGRVLDQCPGTAEVLEEIADAVGDSVKVFVDGGIRTGADVFKALALGADGVLICRPMAVAVYGGGKEGVNLYVQKLIGELNDTMLMCGAATLKDIHHSMIRKF